MAWWIKACIVICCTTSGKTTPGRVTSHSTGSVVPLTAYSTQVPLMDICKAATCRAQPSFMRHYRLDHFESVDISFQPRTSNRLFLLVGNQESWPIAFQIHVGTVSLGRPIARLYFCLVGKITWALNCKTLLSYMEEGHASPHELLDTRCCWGLVANLCLKEKQWVNYPPGLTLSFCYLFCILLICCQEESWKWV